MKKLYIAGIVLLASMSFVQAQEGVIKTQGAVRARGVIMDNGGSQTQTGMSPTVMTVDSTLDVQVRALTKEMEVKITAIREEYALKIKTLTDSRNNIQPRLAPAPIKAGPLPKPTPMPTPIPTLPPIKVGPTQKQKPIFKSMPAPEPIPMPSPTPTPLSARVIGEEAQLQGGINSNLGMGISNRVHSFFGDLFKGMN